MDKTDSAEPPKATFKLLFKTQSVLDRFRFLATREVGKDTVERGGNYFEKAEARAIELAKFDTMFYEVHSFLTKLLMEQAYDAYVIGLSDAVPVLCRVALEGELTDRYLSANNHDLVQKIADGASFKTLVNGRNACLENLIQWATSTTPPILVQPITKWAKDIQEVGNDYTHAYAMRRAGKPMSGTGNLLTNTRAIEVYEKALKIFCQLK
jgi:hypothetical protein